jgi:hypothetical protein
MLLTCVDGDRNPVSQGRHAAGYSRADGQCRSLMACNPLDRNGGKLALSPGPIVFSVIKAPVIYSTPRAAGYSFKIKST